jgi:cellulose biosynthesis protein BcsQ
VSDTLSLGEIITFYSYKGGTGRTMALANVGCILAEKYVTDKGVLAVDWDLEAPGLHRFLPGNRPLQYSNASNEDLGLDEHPGLIDLFLRLDALTPPSEPTDQAETEERAETTLARLSLDEFVFDTGVLNLSLLQAGRNDDGKYSERVNTFNWEGLFKRSPLLFRMLAEELTRRYRYVLIDSRTGLTDISGICTMIMPQKLVVVFTPNQQSLSGIRNLMKRATDYRSKSDDLRPLIIFPLPSRIEATRDDLRSDWRLGNRSKGIPGYEPVFADMFQSIYGLSECDLKEYFDEVQVQQSPDYAYGEQIAVQVEQASDRFSLAKSYEVFTNYLINLPSPWRQTEMTISVVQRLRERFESELKAGKLDPARAKLFEAFLLKSEESFKQDPARVTNEELGKLETTLTEMLTVGRSPTSPESELSQSRAHEIYISHVREDRAISQKLATALEERGWSVFWNLQLRAGERFDDVIERELSLAKCVIVLWSERSVQSDYVRDEATYALELNKLVPVIIGNVPIPFRFKRFHTLDLRDWDGSTQSPKFRRLEEDISALVRQPGDRRPVGERGEGDIRFQQKDSIRGEDWLAGTGEDSTHDRYDKRPFEQRTKRQDVQGRELRLGADLRTRVLWGLIGVLFVLIVIVLVIWSLN